MWSYEDPFKNVAQIKGYLAFYPSRVDRIDETSGEGWSVLLTGQLRPVSDHTQENEPVPWAGGDRPVLLRLITADCSGRRIVAR